MAKTKTMTKKRTTTANRAATIQRSRIRRYMQRRKVWASISTGQFIDEFLDWLAKAPARAGERPGGLGRS